MRVDFYILATKEPEARWQYACRLLEKIYTRGHRIFVYCADKQQAEHLDELLWTYQEDSFIPHNLQGEGPEPPPPVQIGHQNEPRGFNDVLLNLTEEIPQFVNRFKRVIELVNNDEEAKQISRQHYREYRHKDYEIHTHDIA